jgi:hypothetical protein
VHNQQYGSTYKLVALSDAPDALLRHATGNTLGAEVTTTEDRPGDTAAALGRSERRQSLEALAPKMLMRDAAASILFSRIESKLAKDYGGTSAC